MIKYEKGSKVATRQAYGDALVEYGADPRIVVMDADLSKSTKTDGFKKTYPERFINTGIAEGNMRQDSIRKLFRDVRRRQSLRTDKKLYSLSAPQR